jgi:hypothetical protein
LCLLAAVGAAIGQTQGEGSPSSTRAAAACDITQDRSRASTTPASIEFVNQTPGTVNVYWLGFDGTRQFWFSLPTGRSQVQGTYIGHAWVVLSAGGTCIGFVVAQQAQQRYEITGPSAPTQVGPSAPANAARFSDPSGDSGRGPDIGAVAVWNDAAGNVSLQITAANRTRLEAGDDAFNVCLDTDRNPSTGVQDSRFCPRGTDYTLYAVWEAFAIFLRWNGSRFEPAPRTTLSFASAGANGITITINRSELGGTGAFDFQLSTEPVPGDTAPNSGTWTYTLRTQPAAAPAGPASGWAALGCKRSGLRYFGAASGRAKVCFTLSPNRRRMSEHSFELCPSSRLAATPTGASRAVAVRANGSFSTVRPMLAAGGAGIGFVNVTFSGRVRGARASGSLVGRLPGSSTPRFRCSWTAQRVTR